MIAHLKGILSATDIDHAVIDVGGVGYLVGASSRTLSAIGPVGEACMLHTEMLVAEDFIRLVGFASAAERVGCFHDGNQFGGGEVELFTYGPDADVLFGVIEEILRGFEVRSGSYAIKRYGAIEDPNVREERVELA